jgi:hypothetical protein
MGTPKGQSPSGILRNKLSHANFFRVCTSLVQNKDWFLDNLPNDGEAAEKLSELSGIKTSPSTICRAKAATGGPRRRHVGLSDAER